MSFSKTKKIMKPKQIILKCSVLIILALFSYVYLYAQTGETDPVICTGDVTLSNIAVTDDKRTAESITAWTQRFPRSILSFDENRKLCLVTQLPSGGSFGMAKALSSLSGRVTVDMLGMKIYGAWGFPTNLWDVRGQRWRAPEDGLREWFEKMNA